MIDPKDSPLFRTYENFGAALTRQDWAAASLHVNIQDFRAALPGNVQFDYSGFRAEVDRQMIAFPEFGERIKYLHVATSPNLLMVHYITDPVFTGPLHAGSESVPPTGERITIKGVDIVEFTDGRIYRFTVLNDWRYIQAQLLGIH